MKTNKTKKVSMPSGIRNKLVASISMLLVSSVLVVSTTFAWFTLSTAPEVTGITTSVGANGNLEMALLTTATYASLSDITSAVGDSSAKQGAVAANVTWGNLVDLSDASYGLASIKLQPARLNISSTDSTTIAAVGSLLKTATYGKDGRVVDVTGTTYASGSYSTEGKVWDFDSSSLTYGVRAIGANDNLTAQQAGLIAAKTSYNAKLTSAKSTIQSAMSTNGSAMASAITTMAMNASDAALTAEQQAAIVAMVDATASALEDIDAAYQQVLLAAVSTLDATSYSLASSAINGAASYSAAITALQNLASASENPVSVTVPTELTTAAATLQTQKNAVAAAKAKVTTQTVDESGEQHEVAPTADDYKAALKALVDYTAVSVNGYKVGTPADTSAEGAYDNYLMGADGNINSTFMNAVLNAGGAVVEMPDGSGVFAYVGQVAGNYQASCKVSITYKGLSLSDMNAIMKTTATVDTTIPAVVNGVTASSTGATTALSDTYGYALDFAFRTNAASSYLQLQTAGAQRVYTDSTSTETLGGGSTMTFSSLLSDSGVAVLSDAQIKALMGAIRVAFIDPTAGTIYGVASLDNITTTSTGDGFTGELTLKNYALDTNGKMTLTEKTDDASTTDKNEAITLMSLPQNTAVKLTVVVWLDGDNVDNTLVANGATSLTGSMNLQFSSSATLQPMQNTALKNLGTNN
jgi:hypothetical protein